MRREACLAARSLRFSGVSASKCLGGSLYCTHFRRLASPATSSMNAPARDLPPAVRPLHCDQGHPAGRVRVGAAGDRGQDRRHDAHRLEMHTAAGQALDFTVKCDMYLEGTRLAVYRR